jgi:predicted dehydrogenase
VPRSYKTQPVAKAGLTLRVALLGYGYWGPNYARLFREIPRVELAAICDVSASRTLGLEERFPQTCITSDPSTVLSDTSIDAVVIATPPSSHGELIRSALTAGKHVLVEKPITFSAEDARELGELAKRVGRILMVGHVFEYNDCVRATKSFLDEGVLGKPYYLHFARTGLGPIRQDVNVVWDLIPHDLSILLFLFPDQIPVRVSATGGSYIRSGNEDVVFAVLQYSTGMIAHIHASWLDPSKVRRMTLIGSEKMLVFDDVSTLEPIRIYSKGAEVRTSPAPESFGDFQVSLRDGDVLIPKVQMREPLRVQAEEFLHCIGSGSKPVTDAENGARVVELCQRIEDSLRSGRAR